MKLARLLELHRTTRVASFDDPPFSRQPGSVVPVGGGSAPTPARFEAML